VYLIMAQKKLGWIHDILQILYMCNFHFMASVVASTLISVTHLARSVVMMMRRKWWWNFLKCVSNGQIPFWLWSLNEGRQNKNLFTQVEKWQNRTTEKKEFQESCNRVSKLRHDIVHACHLSHCNAENNEHITVQCP